MTYLKLFMNPWKELKRPIVCLAPMEGYTDSAFRQLVRWLVPNVLLFTEFTSVDALYFSSEKSYNKISFDEAEHPVIVQVFGKELKHFAEVPKIIEAMGADAIDINMGCPAKKVVNSCHGSALIDNPELAFKIVETVVKNTKLPVSVKTRIGFHDYDEKQFLWFCKNLVDCGAQALTMHGRTAKQKFTGVSDWDPIYRLKEEVSVPIIGNGDIRTGEQAKEKIKNLDGVMIGRASFGNPWILKEIYSALHNENFEIPTNILEKLPLIRKHCELNVETKGEKLGMLQIRKHLSQYIHGIRGAKQFREKLVRVNTLDEVNMILNEIKQNEENFPNEKELDLSKIQI